MAKRAMAKNRASSGRRSTCAARLSSPRRWTPRRRRRAGQGFTALADPVRLRVLSMLAAAPEGEVCVCDFVEPLGKSQPTISHHLKILGEAGLVHGDRRGKWVWYRLDRERLAQPARP